MTTVYIMEQHDQLLNVWRELNLRSARVVHLDFHCDMRDLLVDQDGHRAYGIRDGSAAVDEGNFITHAILEGRVRQVRWVHDVPGGRRDDVPGVKLTTDLTSRRLWRRLRRRGEPGVPFVYEAMTFSEWDGHEPDEFLDIDWDVFASNRYPLATVKGRGEAFLQRSFVRAPEHIAFCYSPKYSHDTRHEFEAFGERLAEKFGARIERLGLSSAPPQCSLAPSPTSSLKTWIKMRVKTWMPRRFYFLILTTYFQGVRWLRYRGVY